MCEIAQELEKIGREKGIVAGRREGRKEGRKEGIQTGIIAMIQVNCTL